MRVILRRPPWPDIAPSGGSGRRPALPRLVGGASLQPLAAIAKSRGFWVVMFLSTALFVGPDANATKITVVKPDSLIRLQGTDTYCTVLRQRIIGITVAC